MKTNERETWIDFLKGFAMICVIMGHICQGLIKAGFLSNWENMAEECIYSFHMPMMFYLSGYLAAYTCVKERYGSLGLYIVHNFSSLYIPNLLFIFLWWSIKTFIYAGNEIVSLKSLLMGYGSFWFLPALFVIRVVHGSMEWFEKYVLSIIFWYSCFLVAVSLYIYSGNLPKLLYWLSFGVFYECGYVLKKFQLLEKDKRKKEKLCLCLAFLIIGILLPGPVNCIYKKFFTGIGISFFLTMIVRTKNLKNTFLEFIGRNSMVYYLLPLCMTAMFRVFLSFIGVRSFFMQLAMGTLGTLTAAYICIWLYTNVRFLNWIEYIFYPAKMKKDYGKNRIVRRDKRNRIEGLKDI